VELIHRPQPVVPTDRLATNRTWLARTPPAYDNTSLLDLDNEHQQRLLAAMNLVTSITMGHRKHA
jgi:hypothetical protein